MTLQSILGEIEEQLEINRGLEEAIADKRMQLAKSQADIPLTKFGATDNQILEELDDEYKDLYNDLTNRVKELQTIYDEQSAKMKQLLESLSFLYDTQSVTNYEILKTKSNVNLTKSQTEQDISQNKLLTGQIHDLDLLIQQVKTQIKQTDKELGRQAEINEMIKTRGGGTLETVNEIRSLEVDICRTSQNVDDGLNEIMDLQNVMADDEEKFTEEMERVEKLYGYKKIHSSMRDILQQTNRAITQNEDVLNAIQISSMMSENRYNVLAKLPKNKLSEEEIETDVDSLIQKLKMLQKRQKNEKKAQEMEMADVLELISKSEKKLKNLTLSLENAQVLLKAQNRDMKEIVKTRLDSNFEEEKNALASIEDYKLRTPNRGSPKKSLIPRRTPK